MSDAAGANKRIDQPTGTEFVGHEWDGIEELNTPLPRWWLWTFYATIAWALVYVILYPAWPLFERATAGTLGWSSRGELAKEMSAAEAARQGIIAQIAATDIEALADNPELMQAAVSGGAAAFKVNCVQCHGAGAAGSKGYPNLNDDDWIWGGTLTDIEYTLTHGIRWEAADETRVNYMPAFDGLFEPAQVDALTGHVLSLSGKGKSSPVGAQTYADNCAACHGAGGEGMIAMGAPALNDAIWLFGGTPAEVKKQILQPRHGVMPAWKDRLDPVTIKMLAAYVHSRGGGQQAAPAEPQADATTEVAQTAKAENDG
ncbi:cytochrome-c oxidase, cbb3-type subunit III [Porphyrobacter sp. HT-58-2]|uniref:cytochrome-c oxidase, cbb3-type subunit III n=1 Tax=Porphyrobacter sp. HT-58-2 TaxID=2023229 RepID=UPI000CDC8C04|nr:cytochrome-c oxidase, cbb3-type subunit III [Porphyrobacter sp. HT-58-2]AUX69216.1 cytochrome-c oxidase, cbb3-type subunit III [Porphyrobacter sp. HT-58-2]